jgi:hypothetical protein
LISFDNFTILIKDKIKAAIVINRREAKKIMTIFESLGESGDEML